MIQPLRKLELLFWGVLPGLITLVLTIVVLMAKHLSGLSHFMPILPLIPIFYWGMMHAREMPYWFVFLLGLMMDAVTGQPLGLSSLLYVVFLGLLHAQRKYFHKEGFVIKWGYFSGLLAAICALTWILLSLFHAEAMRVEPALMQWLLTVCCYPVLHKAFDGINDHIHTRRWQILHGR